MTFDLRDIVRRERSLRRSKITLRTVSAPAVQATDLYRAAYAPVIDLWTERSERLIASYDRTINRMTTDSPADLSAILDETDNEFVRLFMTLRPGLERFVIRAEKWHRGKWRGAILSATGIDVGMLIGPEAARVTIATAIERNVSLIRSVHDQARTRIADTVFRGLNQRRTAREVAKEIRETVAMSRARSMRIASDQIVKIASALDQERRREAGIDEWEWVHSGKLHPRADHVARNGRVYSDRDPPPDMPGELPFCGCTSRAVLIFD